MKIFIVHPPFFFADTLAAGVIVGIVFAVLIPLCIITVIVIAVIFVCCTGACVCCVAARDSLDLHRNNRRDGAAPQEVNVNVTTGTETPAPPPSYSQTTTQQPSSGYNPYSGPQAAPQFIQPQPLVYTSPGVKLSSVGQGMELKQYPAAVEAADIQVTVAT
jgi:hypothetical protein